MVASTFNELPLQLERHSMALDAAASAPDQNGTEYVPGDEADPAEQTAIEEASVIHLLRVLVAEAAPPAKVSDDVMDHDSPAAAQLQDVNDVTCEEAGCLLWDMSASRPVARVMLRNRALEALEVVIARQLQVCAERSDTTVGPAIAGATAFATAGDGSVSPDDRQPDQQQRQRPVQTALRILEICIGTLANLIVTQPAAATAVSGRNELLALLLQPRGPEDNHPDGGLDSTCGAAAGGGALYGSAVWLRELSSPAVLQRVMWVGVATADAQLFARFLDVIVALLHATSSASAAEVEVEVEKVGFPAEARTAATTGAAGVDGGAAAVLPAAGRFGGNACCSVLLECGLIELLHQVLLQALRACMPAEEKYSELGGGGGGGGGDATDVYGGSAVGSDGQRTGASTPSIVSGAATAGRPAGPPAAAAAVALATAATADRGVSDSCIGGLAALAGTQTAAAAAAAEVTPRSDGNWRYNQPPDAVHDTTAVATDAWPEGHMSRRDTDGGGTDGGAPPSQDAAAAAAAAANAAADSGAAAAAATTAAAATAGPVPLSDEAVDAALRLIEELVSPSGPLVVPGANKGPCSEKTQDREGGSGSGSGAAGVGVGVGGGEVLLQLHAARGLRPGLMQLLLGLLRYQYDSMQVVEGLLVVLVDLGPAVQDAVAASTPDQAAAVAARLVELLQESRYSPADGAESSVIQLQQGAWYLLAATLRGALAAAAAAAATTTSPPALKATARNGLKCVANKDPGTSTNAIQARALSSGQVAAAAAAMANWRASWPSLERSLAALYELPRPEGGVGYARACCVAGLGLLEQLWGVRIAAAAAAAADGHDPASAGMSPAAGSGARCDSAGGDDDRSAQGGSEVQRAGGFGAGPAVSLEDGMTGVEGVECGGRGLLLPSICCKESLSNFQFLAQCFRT
ncbi:hypothetical protein VOLCADRAFT_92894 [Volvox carteri f. nagariensis]|uniref:Uncharacterized protein n=1 Tax=Volvox carteri f. nagariensis TaxID=3068 RepID=D8U0R3_VOLCA|nr:uncharacterized protein VOLCADRAFT_92894 [Volvox carteri f. nagariensis]EFJ46684.1 hypothetical protein VOLCADRAFT_92894 [Volvox carteri f. nagariensis]|eukprot:XP_002952213.1 hypothetical protein VOLCADRAFT_92894 [Volvox carteri f. nagariensis]